DRKASPHEIMRPAFAAVGRGEKMHADESAPRNEHDRNGGGAPAQPQRDEIFHIGLTGEHLLLGIGNVLEVAGILASGLGAVDDVAARPENPVRSEYERSSSLIERRIRSRDCRRLR